MAIESDRPRPPTIEELRDRYFGFREFRPGQAAAIRALLDGGRAMAVFPTGGGKSLCYQLPALAVDGLTVVVSPLIALMKDQIDFLQGRGIAAARLDSSMTFEEVRDVGARMSSGELRLLYVAPERFNNERFLAELKRLRIGLFAIDEAHCISEWGHNFRPDYLKLADAAREISAERILALTATATPQVVEDVCRAFGIPREDAIVTGFYRPNLTLLTTPVLSSARDALLVQRLRDMPRGAGIVYVTLQKTAERVATMLVNQGFAARAYHAGMSPEERTDVQNWWIGGPDGLVVATIAFGMGIDKAEVRKVVHYNMPKSLESYSQEIGRAGRDGLPSTVEMLASAADAPTLANFVYGDTPSPASLNSLIDDLFDQPEEIEVSMFELGNRHNLRPLVLRTALTYLELAGAIRKGTPFYAGYEFRPLRGIEAVTEEFDGKPGELVANIVRVAKRGRIWYGVDPEAIAAALAVERRRVIRVLEVLEERGLVQLRASDLRDRFRRLAEPDAKPELLRTLVARFTAREVAEIARLRTVTELVQLGGCQVNALVAYFGETRAVPCGHCSYCLTGVAQVVPPEPRTAMEARVTPEQLRALANQNPRELGSPRDLARFLCGLACPWFAQARLNRHDLFGVLEDHPFEEVLDLAAKLD